MTAGIGSASSISCQHLANIKKEKKEIVGQMMMEMHSLQADPLLETQAVINRGNENSRMASAKFSLMIHG